ncbi:vesicular glutamate transporter 1-like [Macrosteles quadrilineatus]|uniref:vesicular glutamate transporter 1-like n=1 Tax=Macrosteles quadrilineatus TaxID=74068 RepID=UPI0023E35088|nr:vesicular glutamate transporter 1-like [Macrosteles quadrilineatus]
MRPSTSYPTWMFWKRRRYLVTFLVFIGFVNVYSLRVNLSVAIVAMTSAYNVTLANGTVIQRQDFASDSKSEGILLSSFFYGYILTQLLGGWLASRYGGARVFGIGILVTALLTLISPPLAKTNVIILLVVRAMEGIFEGVTFPCIHEVWAHWAPIEERSTLASIGFSGSFLGSVVTMPAAGVIADTLGWEAVFYISGVLALVWCAFWFIIVNESPRTDPKISHEELTYIENSIGNHSNKDENGKIHHPWGKILTSMPVWAIVVAHTCENWGYYTLITQLPTFMRETLNFEIEKAGFISSLPYLAVASILQFSGRLSDFIQNSKILSVTKIRKIFCCSAFLCQTVSMFLAGHMKTPTSITVCLVLGIGFGAFAWAAFGVNHLDVAPQHAGLSMGLSNTFATLPGILSPLLTGYLVTNRTEQEWKLVFYVASAIYLFGALFYAIFASGERQSWAIDKDPKISTVTYKNRGYDDKPNETR